MYIRTFDIAGINSVSQYKPCGTFDQREGSTWSSYNERNRHPNCYYVG
ncbi:hypothetical protein J41TS4_46600 [Paenibacillus apis]|uniref:Uncharacterized protein n=1 Tax=Paenibacillus apis TaxID=1792174 RepID=A0A919YAB5_9BACL|nr:hypothetical protein J41TS4_46600 [Paenibacillus apis]